MEIFKYLTSNAILKINNLLKSPCERGQILEPICCLYRLSLLQFYDDGVKISISENKIVINDSGYIQGVARWSKGDARKDLHNLFNPIDRLYKYDYFTLYDDDEDFIYLLNNAIKGLNKLINTYDETSIIVHSLNLYKKILEDIKNKKEKIETTVNEDNLVIENHLYESFLKLWKPVNIIVLNKLLHEMDTIHGKLTNEKQKFNQDLKKNMFNSYLDAFNNVLNVIDFNVCEIVKKISAGV